MKAIKTLGVAAVAVAMGIGAADARELRFATAAPEKTPWGKWMNGVVAKVKERTGGTLTIKPFYSSQLGNEQTVIRQVIRGRIDIAGNSNTSTSLAVPEFALLAAPYLWDSLKQADCVYDNHIDKMFAGLFARAKLVNVGFVEVGRMILFSKKPLKSPADIAGYKMRAAPTRASTLFFSAVGANPVPLGTVEALPTLKTGGVNGASFPTVYGIAIGTHKLASNITVTRHSHQIGTVTVSKKTYDSLSADHKKALLAFREGFEELRTTIRKVEEGFLGKLKKGGLPVHFLSADEDKAWRAKLEGKYDEFVKAQGGRSEEIWQQIQAAKKSCAGA